MKTIKIMEGVIYKTPDLLELLMCRTQKSSLYLKRSFERILETINYSCSKGQTSLNNLDFENVEEPSTFSKVSPIVNKKKIKRCTVREFPSCTNIIKDINEF